MITSRLPAIDVKWTTSSLNTIQRLSAAKQSAFNRVIMARIELVRLAGFTAIELAIHVIAAAAKFTIAVIEVPPALFIGKINPRVPFNEAKVYAIRAVKLAVAMIGGTWIGIARPQWSVRVYKGLSLIDEPSKFASVACAISSSCVVVGALLCMKHFVRSGNDSLFYSSVGRHFSPVTGTGICVVGFLMALAAIRLNKRKGPNLDIYNKFSVGDVVRLSTTQGAVSGIVLKKGFGGQYGWLPYLVIAEQGVQKAVYCRDIKSHKFLQDD